MLIDARAGRSTVPPLVGANAAGCPPRRAPYSVSWRLARAAAVTAQAVMPTS